jgi:hypothetical protein
VVSPWQVFRVPKPVFPWGSGSVSRSVSVAAILMDMGTVTRMRIRLIIRTPITDITVADTIVAADTIVPDMPVE